MEVDTVVFFFFLDTEYKNETVPTLICEEQVNYSDNFLLFSADFLALNVKQDSATSGRAKVKLCH